MYAGNFEEGTVFKNIHTSTTWKVSTFADYEKYFVSEDGDVSVTLDEDNFKEIIK